jgi:ubiquinone/menaquinone biosynthesis C-methylase UbiE
MTTHQELTGQTDDDLLQRMIGSHETRHTATYWEAFDEHVRPRLSASPVLADLGCGPGILLRDLSGRVPGATLHGYDITPVMIDYARGLDYGGAPATFAVLDIVGEPLPLADGSVDAITMTMVLHLFVDPFALLREVKRVLKPTGPFVLYDFVRTPFAEYLNRRSSAGSDDPDARKRGLSLFAMHNKYTTEDWHWVFSESGFDLLAEAQPQAQFNRMFIAVPQAAS